jgi:hypothetical protein
MYLTDTSYVNNLIKRMNQLMSDGKTEWMNEQMKACMHPWMIK